MTRTTKNYLPLLLTLAVVLLDRVTKQIVVQTMEYGESIPFIGDAVRWTYIHNLGMAFGMKLTGGVVLGWISVVAVVVILFIMMRTPPQNVGTRWVLAAILGGALGNTFDRLRYGYVIDFVDVDLPAFITGMDRWPVWNVADAAVSVGVVLLIVTMFLPQKPAEDELPEKESGDGFGLTHDPAAVAPIEGQAEDAETGEHAEHDAGERRDESNAGSDDQGSPPDQTRESA